MGIIPSSTLNSRVRRARPSEYLSIDNLAVLGSLIRFDGLAEVFDVVYSEASVEPL